MQPLNPQWSPSVGGRCSTTSSGSGNWSADRPDQGEPTSRSTASSTCPTWNGFAM